LEVVSKSASYGSACQPTEGRASEGCRAEARRAKAGRNFVRALTVSSTPQAPVPGHSQRTENLPLAV